MEEGWASQVAQMVKNPPAMQETWVCSWVGKMLWRRAWQPTPVLLPAEPHGQRRLVGYSRWCHRAGHDWVTKHSTHSLKTAVDEFQASRGSSGDQACQNSPRREKQGQDPAIVHPDCQSKQLWKDILVPYCKLTNLMEIKAHSKEQIFFPALCFGEHSPAELLRILLVNG